MPRKKKNKTEDTENKVKIAQIGEFIEPIEEAESESEPKKEVKEEAKEEIKKEEEIPQPELKAEVEKLKDLPPEQLREKVVELFTKIASYQLPEEEKIKFIEQFRFWNGIMFDLLDISDHLKTMVGKTSFSLSWWQALLIYGGGTVGLVFLLRPDLQAKVFRKQPQLGQPSKPEQSSKPEEITFFKPKEALKEPPSKEGEKI